ncbi:MAG: beta/gamma crystallin-related protein [Pseudomonadota bacterium]
MKHSILSTTCLLLFLLLSICEVRAHFSDFRPASWNMQGATSGNENDWVSNVYRLAIGNSQNNIEPNDVITIQEAGAIPATAIPTGFTLSADGFVGTHGIETFTLSEYIWLPSSRGRPLFIYHMPVRSDRPGVRTNMAIVSWYEARELIIVRPQYWANSNPNNLRYANRPVIGITIENPHNDFIRPTTFYSIHAGSGASNHNYNDAQNVLDVISDFHRGIPQYYHERPVSSNTFPITGSWAVLGDFNRDLTNYHAPNYAQILQTPNNLSILRANAPTRAGAELDYGVASDITQQNWSVRRLPIQSDHVALEYRIIGAEPPVTPAPVIPNPNTTLPNCINEIDEYETVTTLPPTQEVTLPSCLLPHFEQSECHGRCTSQASDTTQEIEFYNEQHDGLGRSLLLKAGEYIFPGTFNSFFTHVRIPLGHEVLLYEKSDFEGSKQRIIANSYTEQSVDINFSAVIIKETGIARIYSESGFKGDVTRLGFGTYTLPQLADLGMGNDSISSIKLDHGVKLTAYKHYNFTGWEKEFIQDTSKLYSPYDNNISSIKVEPLGAVIYEDSNYRGTSFNLIPGRYSTVTLLSMGMVNDSISSIKIPSGLKVTVYKDTAFRGLTKTYTSDTPLLEANFNDEISSLIVTY